MVDPDFSKLQYEALLQLLRTTDTLWNSSRLLFARWDISPAQFNVLNLLSDEVRGLTQSQLGKALLTHRSNVTGLVGRLEKRSLVKRSADMGDQRAWRVVLTSDGRKLLRSVLPSYYEAARRVWAGISEHQTGVVLGTLQQLERNAQEAVVVQKTQASIV